MSKWWRSGRKIKMTKISKLILGAGALGVLGIAALPVTSYGASQEVELSVTISGSDSANGGNNPNGYVWLINDKDGGTTSLASTGTDGAASGGLALVGSKVDTSTGITTDNTYGFQVNYTNDTGSVDGGTVFTDGSGAYFYGSDLLVAGAASSVTNTSTPVAVSTSAAGTVNVSIPALNGNAAGGANSAYKYDTTLTPGTYKNTLTITALPN